MSLGRVVLSALVGVLASGCGSSAGDADRAPRRPVSRADVMPHPTTSWTPESLGNAFRRAHERRSVPAMLALYESGCASESMRSVMVQSMELRFGERIQAVRVQPPSDFSDSSYVRNGIRYGLSVPYEGRIVFVTDSLKRRWWSTPYGLVDGIPKFGTMCAR